MCRYGKKSFYLVAALSIAFAQMAKAEPCPSDIVKPFVGKWRGHAVLVPVADPQQQSPTQAEYFIIDCQSFGAKFNYLDENGEVVRTIKFTASPDPAGAGLFAINNGITTDKSGVTKVTGTFRQIQEGTLLGTFIGALGSKPVYMTELMNVTEPQNGVRRLVRTIQMFSGGKGGPYMASRIDCEQLLGGPEISL